MENLKKEFDVAIIGAGHAGLEAAFACAHLGLKVVLFTLNKQYIASAPCNPSIGGPAKGIVTKEIDALGGMQGLATQYAQLQIKMLNQSKGAGVWSLRAQIDKEKYHQWFIEQLEKEKNITVIFEQVTDLIIQNNTIQGIITIKDKYICQAVVITTGTYLSSVCHIGKNKFYTGPNKQETATFLSPNLKKLGIKIIRLKTGTPPRILKDSINFSILEEQLGSNQNLSFVHYHPSFLPLNQQIPCHLTYTNQTTHQIILDNLSKSAMYSGEIKGVGPRYCPSIEDKVVKFSSKPRHQLFIEPETKDGISMYLQGLSTSLDCETQEKVVHSIKGLENAVFLKHAYAIEYDAIDSTQLKKNYELKTINNLFFAGQINGTSGYEEAAGQGLLAGINAALKIKKQPPLILSRQEAYLGVLTDDIMTKTITEPYRLLTSRAEYRLYLRDDNCQDRLIEYGYKIGLVKQEVYEAFLQQKQLINQTISFLKSTSCSKIPLLMKKYHIDGKYKIAKLICRPEIQCDVLLKEVFPNQKFDDQTINKINIEIKFEGYIKKQIRNIKKIDHLPDFSLTSIQDYHQVDNLSLEAIDKLNRIKPTSINEAKKINGINLVDLVAIKYYLDNQKKND